MLTTCLKNLLESHDAPPSSFEQAVYILAEKCGVEAENLRLIHLPLRGRNPSRIVWNLRPGIIGSKYMWLVEEGGRILLVLASRNTYEVRWKRRWRYDPLSGLKLRLAEAECMVGGTAVWRVSWRRGYYEATPASWERIVDLCSCILRGGGAPRRLESIGDFCHLILPQDP